MDNMYRRISNMFRIRLHQLFLSAAALLLLAVGGCRREMELEMLGDRTETLAVQLEGDTRSAVNTTTGKMSWTSGDQIALLTSQTTRNCLVDISTSKVAVPLEVGETRQGYAVYPASAVSTLTASSVAVTYPASYDIRDNLDSEQVPIPMVAVNSSGSKTLIFKHVGGIFKITVTVPAGTCVVRVTLFGDHIVGNAVVTNPGAADATTTITTGSNEVAFTVHSSGLASEETITLNLPVPCGTYTGIELRVYNSSSAEIATYIDNTSRTIAHSHGIKFALETVDPVNLTSGAFSVSDTKSVYLAPGNLMAKIGSYSSRTATASVWKFGKPWEFIGAGSTNGNYLFGIGNASCVGKWVDYYSFQGASCSTSYRFHGLLSQMSDYSSYHGNVEGESQYDGCWNGLPIANGGGYNWRPLTWPEWVYLFNTRTVSNTLSTDARFTLATIGGTHKGMILFPDNYTHPNGTGFVAGSYNTYSNYTATVSLEGWDLMEAAGCVFLPAAGWRRDQYDYQTGVVGCYFTGTGGDEYGARDLYFDAGTVTPSDASHRYRGMTVRLARDVPS